MFLLVYNRQHQSKFSAKVNNGLYVELFFFITDNLASAGSVSQSSNSNQPFSQVNDGNFSSCSTIEGSNTWIQIDIKEISIVSELYFIIAGRFKIFLYIRDVMCIIQLLF